MKFIKGYTNVIAIIEKASGNEAIGEMWLETKAFPKETVVEEIIRWAEDRDCNGKLILTVDESVS